MINKCFTKQKYTGSKDIKYQKVQCTKFAFTVKKTYQIYFIYKKRKKLWYLSVWYTEADNTNTIQWLKQ